MSVLPQGISFGKEVWERCLCTRFHLEDFWYLRLFGFQNEFHLKPLSCLEEMQFFVAKLQYPGEIIHCRGIHVGPSTLTEGDSFY